MALEPACIAADGTISFRNSAALDIAYAGSAYVIAQVMWERGWTVYGSPTQPLGDFLVVAPGYHPRNFAVDSGDEGWVAVTATDLDDFAASTP